MAEKKDNAKKPAIKKATPTKKATTTKKATPTKSPVKKATPIKKASPNKVKQVVKPVEAKLEPKVEIIKDVTTYKPLNVIQPDIKKEVVDELKGKKAEDSKSGKPHWLVRFITLNFIFGWWR